jgi:hypothetical protein
MSGQNPTYPKTFIYKRDAVQVATESSSKIEIFKDLRDGKLYYLDRSRVPVEISTGGSGPGPGTNTNISNANLTFDAVWGSDLAGFAWGIVDSLAVTNPFAIQDNLDILAGTGYSAISIGRGDGSWWDIPVGLGQLSDRGMYIGGNNGDNAYEFAQFDTAIGIGALALSGSNNYFGAVTSASIVVQGAGFADGPYTDVPAVGGSGLGLTVDFSVLGGVVQPPVTINQSGSGYINGENVEIAGGTIAAVLAITASVSENNKENTAVGYECLANYGSSLIIADQEGQNTAVGYRALSSLTGSDGVYLGSFNVALGGRAGEGLINGDTNTIIGHNAAFDATNAWGNTLIGFEVAVGNLTTSLLDGYWNIAIGYGSDIGASTFETTLIGNNSFAAPSATYAGPGLADPNYTVAIGDNNEINQSTDPSIGSQNTGVVCVGVGNNFTQIDCGGLVAVGSFMDIAENIPTGTDEIYTTAVGHRVGIVGFWNDAFGYDVQMGVVGTESAYSVAIGRGAASFGNSNVVLGQTSGIGTVGLPSNECIAIGRSVVVGNGLTGAIGIGNGANPISNSLAIGFSGVQDILLVGKTAGANINSVIELAGDLIVQGDGFGANTEIAFDFATTSFGGQTKIQVETAMLPFTAASPITIDFTGGDAQEFTIDGGGAIDANVGATSSFDNIVTGTYIFKITQGAVPSTINWGNFSCNIKWPSSYGGAPTLSVGSGDIDIITFYSDDAGDLYGTIANKFV